MKICVLFSFARESRKMFLDEIACPTRFASHKYSSNEQLVKQSVPIEAVAPDEELH